MMIIVNKNNGNSQHKVKNNKVIWKMGYFYLFLCETKSISSNSASWKSLSLILDWSVCKALFKFGYSISKIAFRRSDSVSEMSVLSENPMEELLGNPPGFLLENPDGVVGCARPNRLNKLNRSIESNRRFSGAGTAEDVSKKCLLRSGIPKGWWSAEGDGVQRFEGDDDKSCCRPDNSTARGTDDDSDEDVEEGGARESEIAERSNSGASCCIWSPSRLPNPLKELEALIRSKVRLSLWLICCWWWWWYWW